MIKGWVFIVGDFNAEEDCRTWNLTLWGNTGNEFDRDGSDLLASFCPTHGRKETKIPDAVQSAYVR